MDSSYGQRSLKALAPEIFRAALLSALLLAPSPLAIGASDHDASGAEAARQLYLRLTQRHNPPPQSQSQANQYDGGWDGAHPITAHRRVRPPKWRSTSYDAAVIAWRLDHDETTAIVGGKTTTISNIKQQNVGKPMISAVFTTTRVSPNRSRGRPSSVGRQTGTGDYRLAPTAAIGLLADRDGVELLDAFPSSSVFLVVLIGTFFALATTIGNLMVMISIRVDKQLQTISNYFLFSLAVADITIGIISIPLMTYYTALQHWGIGYAACQFWLSIDYLMSNASVLNLLLISFDRYFSVTRPLTYRPHRTTKKALTMISITYIVSIIIWPPWIIGWPYIEGKITVEEGTCVVQFLALSSQNWASQLATVGTSMAAFYLPVSIMILIYYRVFRETKRRQRELKKLQAGQVGAD